MKTTLEGWEEKIINEDSAFPLEESLERQWEEEARSGLKDKADQHPSVLSYIEGVKRGRRIVELTRRRLEALKK